MTERGINRLWYLRSWRWAAWLLAPLAALFALLAMTRRAAYRAGVLRSRHPGVPVVVIGNLSVGGSGKTPFVIWTAQALAQRGRRVGIVSRGYGGRITAPSILPAQADAAIYGDEPALIQAATGLPVAVGADRCAAADLLVRDGNVDVVLSDDGLQHYALRRDVEIVVVDGLRGLGNGWLLPAGPLRELPSRLQGVDAVVFRDRRAPLGVALGETLQVDVRLVPGAVRAVAGGHAELAGLARWRGQTVHAAAGIGMPERFFSSLRAAGLTLIEHPAVDHHAWSAPELDFADGRPVLMTAKDAVKCRGFARTDWYSVGLEVDIPAAQADLLLTRILARLGVSPRTP